MELKELTEDFETLIVAWLKSDDENATNLAHSLAKYAIKKQLPIHGVGITLPNIDELNIEVKKQLENMDEDLVGETTAFRYGFAGCFMWLKNYINKGN